MKKNIFDQAIPKVKQLMSETGRALQAGEIAEHLGVTNSTAYGVLDLMEVFGITQRVKKGKYYYFLKGVYSDEQISAMLPPEKVAKAVRVPKPRGRPRHPRPQPQERRDVFRDEYLSAMRERASSSEGLSALAILGLPQKEASEGNILTTEPEPPVEMVLALMGKEKKAEPPIRSRPFGTVKHLPADFRRLTQGETSHLKNQLRGIDGYEKIDRFNTVFAKFSALECRRYGNLFYFSMGTNPWDNVRKVTVDHSLSDFMVLPIIESKKWSSWNDFLTGLKETKRYVTKGMYDGMLDEFLESEHKLVEITVENRDTNYVKHMLKMRIDKRGLENQIKASHVDEWIYLEKVE